MYTEIVYFTYLNNGGKILHINRSLQHFTLKQTNVIRELCGFQTMADKASDDGRLNTFTQEGNW